MAISTTFFDGWFFHGQFFDHAVGGWLPKDDPAREPWTRPNYTIS